MNFTTLVIVEQVRYKGEGNNQAVASLKKIKMDSNSPYKLITF